MIEIEAVPIEVVTESQFGTCSGNDRPHIKRLHHRSMYVQDA